MKSISQCLVFTCHRIISTGIYYIPNTPTKKIHHHKIQADLERKMIRRKSEWFPMFPAAGTDSSPEVGRWEYLQRQVGVRTTETIIPLLSWAAVFVERKSTYQIFKWDKCPLGRPDRSNLHTLLHYPSPEPPPLIWWTDGSIGRLTSLFTRAVNHIKGGVGLE